LKYNKYADKSAGPKYASKGWPNQDAVAWDEVKGIQVIAVADGHGSKDCFRSEIGSQIAVDVAVELSCKYFDDPHALTPTGINNLKFTIWNTWKSRVKEHWDKHLEDNGPLNDSELRYRDVSDKYKTRFNSSDETEVERYLSVAYGTTLLVAVSTPLQLLFIQIGDGTCVLLKRNGEFSTPVPSDESNFLNVTSSMSEENAFQKIRHALLDRKNTDVETFPIAAFISTDGVDDCFPMFQNEVHLYKLYKNILESVINNGFEATATELSSETLAGLTKSVSQDDISLAFFVYEDIEMLKTTFEHIDISEHTAESDITPEPEPEPVVSPESVVEKTSPVKESTSIAISTTTAISPLLNRSEASIERKALKVGDITEFGHYKWKLLQVEEQKRLLLITEHIIENKAFSNDMTKPVSWSNCDLRKYLNDEFLNGFNEDEKSRIGEYSLKNESNPWFGTSAGKHTCDKIFVLSLEELVKYFGDSGQLKDKNPHNRNHIDDDYNYKRVCTLNGTISSWWLRSPGSTPSTFAIVKPEGRISLHGALVKEDNIGIRPALWMKI
jgi:serine/threonine protein phosphatase PrpC